MGKQFFDSKCLPTKIKQHQYTKKMKNIYFLVITILFVLANCQKPEKIAAVKTGESSNVKATTATIGGVIIDFGDGLTTYGHCWSSTNSSPRLEACDGRTDLGENTSLVDYTSQITGLDASTNYYVRAYVSGSSGSVYGSTITFTTEEYQLPILTTSAVVSITGESAICGGNITDNGGEAVLARGVCWSTTVDPDINDNKTSDGTGIGSFSSQMTGLAANTTYYVRAFATNVAGTSYGNELSFTTTIGVPNVTTQEISNIALTTATGGGNVTYEGTSPVTAKGICWGTSENPTIDNNLTTDGTGEGFYTSAITQLSANTTYFVRAYATNDIGTSYGEQVTFTTMANIISIQTKEVNNITAISATSGGIITSTGSSTISDKGLCWSDYENPTIADKTVSSGTGESTFDAAVTLLIPNKTYYIRAYATNEYGTVYGEQKTFTASDAYYQGFESGTTGVSPGSWNLSSEGAVEGTYCLSTIQSNAEVTITRTLLNDGQIYFYTKNEGVYSGDPITFYIDDVEQVSFNSTSWELRSFPVTSGTHTFKWVRRATGPYDARVYLDYIVMPK